MKILLDKEVAVLRKHISSLFYREVLGLVVWLIEQQLIHVLVLVSVVIHHFQVHDAEHNNLLVKLNRNESKDIHKKESHRIIGIYLSMIVDLISNNVHLFQKVLSINTNELYSYSL